MPSKQYFFISGLPRSGSTLLSAILRQNPMIHADISSPVIDLILASIDIVNNHESNATIGRDRRQKLISSIFDVFYDHVPQPVVFDTNRRWTKCTHVLDEMTPGTKIICMVRNTAWILDSLERLRAQNPLYHGRIWPPDRCGSIYDRIEFLMSPENLVGNSISSLREGLFGRPDMIKTVEYDMLCMDPDATMQDIYSFVGLPYYQHDFSDVHYDNPTYDQSIQMPGMHRVTGAVAAHRRNTVLPPELWIKYTQPESQWNWDPMNHSEYMRYN